MIDYEFTIKRLERELAHAREMQQMQTGRLDFHDASIASLASMMTTVHEAMGHFAETQKQIEETQKQIEENHRQIQEDLKLMTKNVNNLTEALLRQPRNGSGQ